MSEASMARSPSASRSEEPRPALLLVLIRLVGHDFRLGGKLRRLELGVDAVGDPDLDDLRLGLLLAGRRVDDEVDPPLALTERLEADLGFRLAFARGFFARILAGRGRLVPEGRVRQA